MNILPLVFAFLFLLFMTSESFFKEEISTFFEERTYSGLMNAELKVRNAIERKHFYKAPKKPDSAQPAKKKKKASKGFTDNRLSTDGHPLSKLNISSLYGKGSPELYEIAAALIRNLYGKAPFYKNAKIEHLEYRILDAMLENTLPENPSLSMVFPHDRDLSEIFYKMLKGTKRYDLAKGIGYPSLSDYMAITKEEKPMNFTYATWPLIKAVFGDKITESIQAAEYKKGQEKKKFEPLTEEELTTLLMKDFKNGFNLSKMSELISFSKQKSPNRTLVANDKKTGITLKRTY